MPQPNLQPQHKKLKYTEKSLPEKISAYIPESNLFNQLVNFEKKTRLSDGSKEIGGTGKLRKAYISKSQKYNRRKRILRIFLSNLAANQPNQETRDLKTIDTAYVATLEPPSWTFKIEGRFVDIPHPIFKHKASPRKFSEQFETIIVELDRKDKPYTENIIEWKHSPSSQPVDGFEIKRLGDENVKVKITLYPKSATERFKVNSKDLRELLELDGPVSRAELVNRLWQYIAANKLQDTAGDFDYIRTDSALKKIFGEAPIQVSRLPELLMGYLAPIDPFVIEYVIRVDSGPVFKSPHAYDLEVEVEEPSKSRLGPLPSIQTLQKETQAIDEKLDGLMQELHELRAKRDFFNEFSMNPTRFINDAVKIMTRDLQVITGEPSTQLESVLAASMRKQEKDTEKAEKDKEGSGLFELPWVSEAIFHYLATQAEEKTNENITNSFVAGGGNPSATSASITSDGMDRHSSSAIHASQPPSAGVVNAASIAPNAPVHPTQNIPIHPHH